MGACGLGLPSTSAYALDMVAGGYGTAPIEQQDGDTSSLELNQPTPESGMTLDFTPRSDAGLWMKPAGSDEPSFSFGLTARGAPEALDRLNLGASYGPLGTEVRGGPPSALTVGGAMRWSDWSIGGGVGRAQVLGEDVSVMSAVLGYGRFSAGIAYGQAESNQSTAGNVVMLSTDLATWSWLTLESDLAVGSHQAGVDREREGEPVAAGRFGIRLNF